MSRAEFEPTVDGMVRALTPKDGQVRPGNVVTDLSGTAWRELYLNGSGDVTELALGVAGAPLVSGGAAAAPAFGMTTALGTLSADVALTNNATWYDGPSVSLTAGTWLIIGQGALTTLTDQDVVKLRMYYGATTVAEIQTRCSGDAFNGNISTIAVIASTQTVILSARNETHGGGTLAKNADSVLTTSIVALKVA